MVEKPLKFFEKLEENNFSDTYKDEPITYHSALLEMLLETSFTVVRDEKRELEMLDKESE